MADGPSSTIVFDGDSSGAVAALHAVDVEAKRVAAALRASGSAGSSIGDGAVAGADKAVAATKRFESQLKRLNLELESGGRNTAAYIEGRAKLAGADTTALAPLIAQYDQLRAKQALANAEFTKGGKVLTEFGMGAKATSAALRQVPAQFTDIIVSLQGGQAPLTVLLQQGGQLKDVFGGVGNAFKALSGYVLGLINPITLAIGAFATLGYAYTKGAAEAEAFNKSLILSGNIAGTTAGRLSDMSSAVAAASGGSIGKAADTINELVKAGNVAESQFARIARSATDFERVAGVAVAETVKQFSELGKEPLKASEKLTQSTHYLTAEIYQQIKALEDQGDMLGAAKVAQEAWADALDNRIPKLAANLGILERVWNGVMKEAKGAWDAMLGVGRNSTVNAMLSKAQDQYANAVNTGASDAEIKSLGARVEYYQRMVASEGTVAALQADRIKRDEASIELAKQAEKYASNEVKMKREIAKLDAEFARGNKTPQDIENYGAALRGIAKQYADKGTAGPKPKKPNNRLGNAELDLELAQIKAGLEQQTGAYAGAQKVIDALRSAGLTSERDYYASRRQIIDLTSQAQDAAWQQEIDRLKAQKYVGDNAAAEMVKRDKRITEIEMQRDKAHAQAATANVVSTIAETDALNKMALAYEEANIQAQEYLRITAQTNANELSRMGIGNRARGVATGYDQINGKYESDTLRNEQFKRANSTNGEFNNTDAQKLYDDELARLARFKTAALSEWESYNNRKAALDANWSIGASEAMSNYLAESQDIAKQTEDVFTNAFQGMEDALVTFITTGKLSFTNMANSIVADITRIIIKQQIANAAASIMGVGGMGGGFAFDNFDPFNMISFDGGGTTGSGSRSGGLDGKGGFVAMLHPQETVVDHTKGQSTGNTVNVTVNQSFAAGTSRATTLQAAADARKQLEYAGRNL